MAAPSTTLVRDVQGMGLAYMGVECLYTAWCQSFLLGSVRAKHVCYSVTHTTLRCLKPGPSSILWFRRQNRPVREFSTLKVRSECLITCLDSRAEAVISRKLGGIYVPQSGLLHPRRPPHIGPSLPTLSSQLADSAVN